MDNKIIALIAVIILIIAGGAYILGTQSGPTNTTLATNNTTSNINTTTDNKTGQKNDTKQNSTVNVKISAKEAQKIAIGTAQELGGENDTAGTPTLYKWTKNNLHTWVWNVPLYDAKTKKSAGSLDVDAMTGEVIMNE